MFVFDETLTSGFDAEGSAIEVALPPAPAVKLYAPQQMHKVANIDDVPLRGIRVEFKRGQLSWWRTIGSSCRMRRAQVAKKVRSEPISGASPDAGPQRARGDQPGRNSGHGLTRVCWAVWWPKF